MSDDAPPSPTAVRSEVVHRGRLFDVRVDRLRWPDGLEVEREVVVHPGAVCIVPVTDRGTLLFVEQYRHPAGKRLLELPAGTLEPGEEPGATARRELEEEVGFAAGHLRPLGGFYVAPGYTTEYIHLFVATALSPAQGTGDEDEDIAVVELTPAEALARIRDGRIEDGKSIIALLRWLDTERESGLR